MEDIWSLYAIPQFSLQVIGFWPKIEPNFSYTLRGILSLGIMTSYTLITIYTFLFKTIEMIYFLDVMYHFIAYVHFNIKCVFIFYYRHEIAILLNDVREIRLQLDCRLFKALAYAAEIGVMIAIYSQVLPAIFDFRKKSILNAMFPFDLNSLWIFICAYSLYATSYTCVAFAIALDVLMWALLFTCFTLLNDLKCRIRRFFIEYNGSEEDARKFRDIIIYHVQIIEFAKRFGYYFEEMVLGVPLCGIVVLCFGIFNIMTVNQSQAGFTALMTISCSFLQMYAFCHLGQHLQDLSVNIWDVIYECDWLKCSLEIRKSLIVIAIRSRYPLTLNMGKFGQLSFTLLVWIIRAASSYVLVLNKMYSN